MNEDNKDDYMAIKAIHKKIQLWTSYRKEEYAIRLLMDSNDKTNDDFIATTNPDVEYQKIVAEMDAIIDLKFGWDHVLKEFLDNYHRVKLGEKNLLLKDMAQKHLNKFSYHRYPIRLISHHICKYCNKQFDNEQEKNEHDLDQHI